MEYSLGQLLLWVLPVLAHLRLVAGCKHVHSCQLVVSDDLNKAVKLGNSTATCNVMPLVMHCLRNALVACEQESQQDLLERSRSTGTNVTQLRALLDQMNNKYKDKCDLNYELPNTAMGDNNGQHYTWLASFAGLIISTLVHCGM